jgi:hypothetical protein
MAPVFFASSSGSTRACVAALARISAFTWRSMRAISALLKGCVWAKSKRVLSASTCDPFCCTWLPSISRNAWCMRWVAE